VKAKKAYRLHKELGVQLRNKTCQRHLEAPLRADRAQEIRHINLRPTGFAIDQLASVRSFQRRVACVILGVIRCRLPRRQ